MEWEIYLLSTSIGVIVLGLIVLVHFIGTDKKNEGNIEYLDINTETN